MNSRKFILGKEPFIRKADHFENTSTMMWDFIIALIPITIFAMVKMDLCRISISSFPVNWQMIYPLVLVITGAVVCAGIELYISLYKKKY